MIAVAMLGGLMAVVLCHNAKPLAHRLNLLDIPDDRKKHRNATPLMGGLVILLAMIPAAIFLKLSDSVTAEYFHLWIWMAAVAGMTLVGIIDDRHALTPKMRLFLSFGIFGLAAAFDPIFTVRVLDFSFPQLSFGLATTWFAIFFTALCCVGLVNAINMADGKNGLVIGLCIIWLSLLITRAPTLYLPIIALLIVVLTVMLFYNMQSRLFLGDGGAYGLASAIGLLAIAIYNSPGDHMLRAMSASEVVLLFLVPVADSFRLTYARVRRGLSPMSADRDHLHHHLQNKLGWPRGLFAYWAIVLIPGALIFAFA